jgi:hypothetical protein
MIRVDIIGIISLCWLDETPPITPFADMTASNPIYPALTSFRPLNHRNVVSKWTIPE